MPSEREARRRREEVVTGTHRLAESLPKKSVAHELLAWEGEVMGWNRAKGWCVVGNHDVRG